jgi:selenide,water dikinase
VVVGLTDADDAALWVSPKGERIATTIDAFPSFTDDPWLVGRVATLNALSDLDAKGVEPRFAQALVTVPDDLPGPRGEELLFQVLSGVRVELDRLAVTLLGGHTTTGAELAIGLAVEGIAGDGAEHGAVDAARGGWLGIDGLRPGLELVLTKPLGTGVLFHADRIGRLRGPWLETATRSMLQPNRAAARIARAHRVEAATDVSGFGLLGHLGEMARASRVVAELDAGAVPALPGALELLGSGLRSTAHAHNLAARRLLLAGAGSRDPDHPSSARTALLFDPQTSGGLLLAAPPDRTGALVAALHAAGYERAARVGRVVSAVRGDSRSGVRLGEQGPP